MHYSTLDYFGIAVGALSGVLAARGREIDLFGVVVLAVVTALGGGTVRDLLCGTVPVPWLQTSAPLGVACGTALVCFFLFRTREPHAGLFQISDAVALSFFTIAGTQKGLGLGLEPFPSAVLGVITGVFGGVLRDVLTGRVPVVFQPSIYLYATASFAGGLAYCFLQRFADHLPVSWLAVAITLILRLGAVRFRLALPVFSPPR